MKYLLLIIVTTLMGCGKFLGFDVERIKTKIPKKYIHNSQFDRFYDSFIKDTGVKVPMSTITVYAKLSDGIAGSCSIYDNGTLIKINTSHWQFFSDTRKLQTMYHELGHCVLRLLHRNEIYRGQGVSIMNAELNKVSHYGKFFEEYNHELISGNNIEVKTSIDTL